MVVAFTAQSTGARPTLKKKSPALPLEADGVVYEHEGERLIGRLDLHIEAGGITVLMGPNGAGKSLTLRLLHGLLNPTQGRVLADGRLLDATARRQQAMVFQKPVLLRRSVEANIRYTLSLRQVPRADRDRLAAEALAGAALDHLARRPARVLSAGEQQRLAIARALALRPEVLFLDEPTANLDPAATLEIERQIGTANRDGTKIVLVTHDIGQAHRLADDVAFMFKGRIVERAAAADFFATAKSPQAQAYLAGRIVI